MFRCSSYMCANTDVPSFVSGRYLAIFDPHCRFLPGLAADNPGKRIDFVANPVADDFPDQVRSLKEKTLVNNSVMSITRNSMAAAWLQLIKLRSLMPSSQPAGMSLRAGSDLNLVILSRQSRCLQLEMQYFPFTRSLTPTRRLAATCGRASRARCSASRCVLRCSPPTAASPSRCTPDPCILAVRPLPKPVVIPLILGSTLFCFFQMRSAALATHSRISQQVRLQ